MAPLFTLPTINGIAPPATNPAVNAPVQGPMANMSVYVPPTKPTSVVSSNTSAKGPVANAQNTVNNPPAQPLYNPSNGFITPAGLSAGLKPVQPGDPAL